MMNRTINWNEIRKEIEDEFHALSNWESDDAHIQLQIMIQDGTLI